MVVMATLKEFVFVVIVAKQGVWFSGCHGNTEGVCFSDCHGNIES